MTHLTAWFTSAVVGRRKVFTEEQENGTACVLCGATFLDDDQDRYGRIGLRRVYACRYGVCVIDVVDDVAELFLATFPDGRQVDTWFLGVDDVPLRTAPDGSDMTDREHVAAIAAQPHVAVEIVHPGGILKTRPLPWEYAVRIAEQAMRLHCTAIMPVCVVTPHGPGHLVKTANGITAVKLDDGRERHYPASFVKAWDGAR